MAKLVMGRTNHCTPYHPQVCSISAEHDLVYNALNDQHVLAAIGVQSICHTLGHLPPACWLLLIGEFRSICVCGCSSSLGGMRGSVNA